MSENTGKVSQIIGPVVDVAFENIKQGLPDIYDSLVIKKKKWRRLNFGMPTTHWGRYRANHIHGLN